MADSTPGGRARGAASVWRRLRGRVSGGPGGADEHVRGMWTNTLDARHAWLARGFGDRPDPDDPDAVLAMQVVLHIEKHQPPRRSALLSAAASAVAALCLDERCGPGGQWEHAFKSWTGARIRKVARRARGRQWQDVQDLAGVTATCGGAQARALVPGRVGDLDSRVKKLQISGTDLPDDEPGAPDGRLPCIWVDASLGMSTGKAAAQAGHAAMLLAGAMTFRQVRAWAGHDFACSVREADAGQWARLQHAEAEGAAVGVRDAGFTEVAAGAMTVIATSGTLG